MTTAYNVKYNVCFHFPSVNVIPLLSIPLRTCVPVLGYASKCLRIRPGKRQYSAIPLFCIRHNKDFPITK